MKFKCKVSKYLIFGCELTLSASKYLPHVVVLLGFDTTLDYYPSTVS